jgi:hypothetical protein
MGKFLVASAIEIKFTVKFTFIIFLVTERFVYQATTVPGTEIRAKCEAKPSPAATTGFLRNVMFAYRLWSIKATVCLLPNHQASQHQ